MEVIISILAVVIGIPLIVVLAGVLVALIFVTGWFLILLWMIGLITPDHYMFGYVIAAFVEYGIVFIGWPLLVSFFPNGEGLPPALKFLANLLPAPGTSKGRSGLFDLRGMVQRLREDGPVSQLGKKMRASQYRKAADDIRTDTEFQDAQAELHRAAQEFNRAKMRAEEAEKARRRT